LYPCDVLFIHRDAEGQVAKYRIDEIEKAVKKISTNYFPSYICVVPVRMSKAWMLSDLDAIRKASGNPYGTVKISLPQASKLEEIPDPKQCLFDLLLQAADLSPQRRRGFDKTRASYLVTEHGRFFCAA
jgi:hypothetical protein